MKTTIERWHPLKVFFPTKVLISYRNDEKYTTTWHWHSFACGFSPSAYHFFKHVLEEWYPLGLRLLVQSKLEIYEEEGINKSRQEFIELQEFLKQKIQKKEKKLWQNILNQYIALYRDQKSLFCLDKLVFKIQLTPKINGKIEKELRAYLSYFLANKIKAISPDITLFSFSKQMDALLEYMQFRLASGDSMCGFAIKEGDFLRWWMQKDNLSPRQLISPFEKRYNFLELLLILDFAGIIKLQTIVSQKLKDRQGDDSPLDMFWGSLDILKNVKGLKADAIKTNFQTGGSLPFCIEKNGWGYLKFGKYGKKKKIGKASSRHFRLLKTMLSPLGVSRTVDSVFDAIKLPEDKNDTRLQDWNTSANRKVELIKYAIKELQKGNKLESRIRFEFNSPKTQLKAKLLN